MHWLWNQKRWGEAPEGKLKGKGSDRKAASLTVPIRAETSLLRKERRCKTGGKKKKKGYNKARILPRGDADSSSCRKKEEMATAALQERIRCCHRRGGFEENCNSGNRGERWIKSLSDASKSLLPGTGCTRMARGTGATAGTTATSAGKRAEEKHECRGQSLAWGLGTAANSC